MLMADTMAIFFVILGFMLALPALWLLCRGLWPRAVSGAAVASNTLLRPFLVGLPVTLIALIAAVAARAAPGAFGWVAAMLAICIFLVFASTGVAGFATRIGTRLASPLDTERPWRATIRGGIVLELSYLLPVLGWFVILPLSLIIGAGSVTIALLKLGVRVLPDHAPESNQSPAAV
jgi:hypothetical protein